ncbi:hypothetical protein HpCK35_00250 [Helicobacter pylori]
MKKKIKILHKIEKFQAENLELKNKITSLEQTALESKLKTDLLNVLLTGGFKKYHYCSRRYVRKCK